MTGGAQLRLPVLPLDPVVLSKLSSPERGQRYAAANLDPLQIAAAEEAIRRVRLGTYARRSI